MTGYSVFNQQIPLADEAIKVTEQLYEEWQRNYILDGLRGIRYGQSFCNRFNITDHLLYYTLTLEQADTYIRKYYIA